MAASILTAFQQLRQNFEGELYFDDSVEDTALRKLYATDASVYQELPLAVAIPKTIEAMQQLIQLATDYQTTLIPRAAATSLAGQVVGNGIVVDISKYFDKVLEINAEERWVRVQPGVIRDDLNKILQSYGLMFGPETSTASRAMIGGMIGNNSCGLHSIRWGSVRDHLLDAQVLLSDGSLTNLTSNTSPLSLKNEIFSKLTEVLNNPHNQELIRSNFPKKSITRRNTGYALDALLDKNPPSQEERGLGGEVNEVGSEAEHTLLLWRGEGSDGRCREVNRDRSQESGVRSQVEHTPLMGRGEGSDGRCREVNRDRRQETGVKSETEHTPLMGRGAGGEVISTIAPLIAGSEGTLCFVVEAKLNLLPLPPATLGLLCVHCSTLQETLQANIIAMNQHIPLASELMDKYVMDFTKEHPEYKHNRYFIEGDPAALLMVEFGADTQAEVEQLAMALVQDLKEKSLGYAYPLLFGDDAKKAWDIRKAGLGLSYNLAGDAQPVNLIEDGAVTIEDLPAYVADLEQMLDKHQVVRTYTAHAGAGELHILPILNLKSKEGRKKFRTILAETAGLLKKYNGSLSGEHGDGRLRGEFIPFMMGKEVYQLFKEVKNIFDPKGIFNRGKITDTPPMDEFLRYELDQTYRPIDTIFDFSQQEGILHLAEKCSGSGDCRKTHLTGGTMCPSFMATRSERDTTRARANLLRQFYTEKELPTNHNFEVVKEVLDLCLSCKACKTECPSSVDMTKLKAEFMQSYYDQKSVPLRSKLIADFSKQMRLASYVPSLYNTVFKTPALRRLINQVVGFHPDRTMPLLGEQTLEAWYKKKPLPRPLSNLERGVPSRMLSGRDGVRFYLFCDEFTNYNDVEIGKKTILLFEQLGYEVIIPKHVESGRTYLSKGLVRKAQELAIKNVEMLKDIISTDAPLIGIEPSAILSFRDEYIDLVPSHLKEAAQKLAKNALTIDEFIAQEIDNKRITSNSFTADSKLIKLHGHCHQKALGSMTPTKKMLSLPKNYKVQLIPSGCCGMAGSFGYEKEHYDVSMQIGELVLFPIVRQQPEEVIIAAAGTSCRHQIKDGTSTIAKHPVEILYEALHQ